MTSSSPLSRFDGAALWPHLSADQQAAIGAAALEWAAARHVELRVTEDAFVDGLFRDERWAAITRAQGDAVVLGTDLLEGAVLDALAEDAFEGPDGRPLLPSTLGPICHACGCTDQDMLAWDDQEGDLVRTSWSEPDLCSACAGRPAA
jgi:hypothetical protein